MRTRRRKSDMNIERARSSDLPDIQALLTQAQLPAGDLSAAALEHFLVIRAGDEVTGAVGLEPFGTVALLRSLVVTDDLRGRGFGGALTDAAEDLARTLDVASVYLLTTSADAFFLSRGYRPIQRSEAPEKIRSTTQFNTLCPDSAVLMTKEV